MSKQDPMRQRHIYLPTSLDAKLMRTAEDERRPIAYVIREAIRQYIEGPRR